MANKTTRTQKKDAEFFDALAKGKPVSQALPVGYSRSRVYAWREIDEDFARHWDNAIQDAVERMEAEADRRAVEGVEKPLTYKGQVFGHVREFSDVLLMFRLKALAPTKYRENIHQQVEATVDHNYTDPKQVLYNTVDTLLRRAEQDGGSRVAQ